MVTLEPTSTEVPAGGLVRTTSPAVTLLEDSETSPVTLRPKRVSLEPAVPGLWPVRGGMVTFCLPEET